jgi:hypothetical protein
MVGTGSQVALKRLHACRLRGGKGGNSSVERLTSLNVKTKTAGDPPILSMSVGRDLLCCVSAVRHQVGARNESGLIGSQK